MRMKSLFYLRKRVLHLNTVKRLSQASISKFYGIEFTK